MFAHVNLSQWREEFRTCFKTSLLFALSTAFSASPALVYIPGGWPLQDVSRLLSAFQIALISLLINKFLFLPSLSLPSFPTFLSFSSFLPFFHLFEFIHFYFIQWIIIHLFSNCPRFGHLETHQAGLLSGFLTHSHHSLSNLLLYDINRCSRLILCLWLFFFFFFCSPRLGFFNFQSQQ